MSYSYIILIDDKACWNGGKLLSTQETTLSNLGMRDSLTSGPVKIFVSNETPTLTIPGGGLIIGHLFSRDGRRVTQKELYPQFARQCEFGAHILENYWGDYLLIYPTTELDNQFKLLRDPSGGVPCIYSIKERSGFITSDISTAIDLNLYNKQIDWDFIPHSLKYPYLKTTRTGLSDVNELLPGCSLVLHGTNVILSTEWSPWNFTAANYRYSDPHEAASDLRATISSVVKAWAETDGSLLLELSGGLDSSIVAACLKETTAHIACCTLMTPVPGADEQQYARHMSDALGIELQTQTIRFDDARFEFDVLPNTVMPRMAALQYAVNEVMENSGTSQDVTSFISGAGGDTVFCYLRTAAPAADAFKERGLKTGLSAISDLATLHQCTFWKAGRLTLRKLLQAPRVTCNSDILFLDPSRNTVLPENHPWFDQPIDSLPGDRERIFDLIGTQVFRDSSPRGGKFRRLPLLSQPVMETCLKVPTWMWIAGGQNRALARAAFSDILPMDILNRRSKGTFTSFSGAVYERNKKLMRNFLLTGHLQAHNQINSKDLEEFFEKKLPARDRSFMRIFELCMVENWIRHQLSDNPGP